ncbi:MAG: helix-turn-helix transcriptional regulator [Oscillospiraceae bacterium]|nr:helix-turn-helix transcriptional regulator [Oscillospiraceae bacterium]
MIDYSPLWETMKRKGITQYALIQGGIDRRTLDWLKKDRNITMLTLEKLCVILDCTPDDIVRFIPQTEASE